MKKNRTLSIILLTVCLGILAACGNTSEEPSAKPDDTSNQPQIERKPHSDNASNETEETETNPSNEEPDKESTELTKEQYLQKLNEMEEADRNGEAGTTTVELENQETERYEKWDAELNRIYGILKEKLSPEQMDQLKEEQRAWMEQRDEEAKKSSLAYQGGTMESLEYVATQASLTRERCYELVAKYME
ncbi:lysozyme inhibitor LprI family protein [Sporosarcina sp. Te-1]|uniref:lysozyme inhibitor LprI family protein n=1 Tax=Sporosarcina sp. Te-1 TaxID=2818390 RepID=UPI001A9D24B9|nr:lysozyme inhibitor LprI family protein [Sporosarcina sp. Te-1]QTD39517.1 DUF1311 domain-containing protein [Sporosarcina sp. Te-1]